MNVEQVKSLIAANGYADFVLFGDPRNIANSTVVQQVGHSWETYVTTERADRDEQSVRVFATESEALDDFVRRLASAKEYEEIMNSLGPSV